MIALLGTGLSMVALQCRLGRLYASFPDDNFDIFRDEGQYTEAFALSRLAYDLDYLLSPLAESSTDTIW